MKIVTPAFIFFTLAWNRFFHPLTFSLYVSLGLKWVSYRQHIYGSCFPLSQSVSFGWTFDLFIFKVIIDIYVPIAIFLIVWGWFCRSFSSLVFFDYIYIYPFNICCKAGLVVLNSLNFCLSEKILISWSIFNEIFARYTNFDCRFSPPVL